MDSTKELAAALARLIDLIQYCDEEQIVLSSLHPAVMHGLTVLGKLGGNNNVTGTPPTGG
jgi:hypothetical protein